LSISDPFFHTRNHYRYFLSLRYLFTFNCTNRSEESGIYV
jgi:hypothetical protein